MQTIEAIESAVEKLARDGLAKFRDWFAEFNSAAWDKQIESDSNAGKLDEMANEAIKEYHAGRTKAL